MRIPKTFTILAGLAGIYFLLFILCGITLVGSYYIGLTFFQGLAICLLFSIIVSFLARNLLRLLVTARRRDQMAWQRRMAKFDNDIYNSLDD